MGRPKKRSLITTPPAPSAPVVEDPSDRQNLADTGTASAAEADEALAEPPTESDLPTESAIEPETTDLAKTTGQDDPERADDAPENPAGSKQELLSTTPPPADRAELPPDFDTKPEEDEDWFLATGAPAPRREVAAAVDEPEIVVAQRNPVVWGVALAGAFFGFLLLIVVLWFVAT